MRDPITVTVQDEHLADIDQLAERLRCAGMHIEQIMRPIGIITGSVAPAQRHSITTMPGVAAIEDEMTCQLPPPDSEVQ
jgi:hypothetical protein